MSFSITKKTLHHAIGIFSALCITGFMTFGFLQSYQQSKLRQVHKIDLVEVAIFADKPAAETILYEVSPYTIAPSSECIRRRVDVASTKASITTSPRADTATAEMVAETATAKVSAAVAKKNPIRREPALVAAQMPKCIAASIAPSGYLKLAADGFVGLALNLDKTGRVERGEIEKSSGFADLDSAALTQVKDTWQFEPCKKQNKAVACKQYIGFRWDLK